MDHLSLIARLTIGAPFLVWFAAYWRTVRNARRTRLREQQDSIARSRALIERVRALPL